MEPLDTSPSLKPKPSDEQRKNKGKIMTDENDEDIAVGIGIYWKLYYQYYGLSFIISSNLVMCAFVCSRLCNDYLVGNWAE
jgi:hypothetical protein